MSEVKAAGPATFACKRCGQEVMWAKTRQGKAILLEAAPIEQWEAGAFVFNEDARILRAERGSTGWLYRCHWGECHDD